LFCSKCNFEIFTTTFEDVKSCDQFVIERLDNSRLSNNTLLEDLEEILDELNGRSYSLDEEQHLNKVIDATNTYYNTLTKLQPESTEQSVNNLNVIARALGFELPDILVLGHSQPEKTNGKGFGCFFADLY